MARTYAGKAFWALTSKPHFDDEVRAALDPRCKRVEATSIDIH